MSDTEEYKEYYLYGSYAMFGFTVLLACCICFNYKNIKIGIAVMKCTAEFIAATP